MANIDHPGSIAMTVQEANAESIESLDTLSLEALEGALEYDQFVSEPVKVSSTAEEPAAIERGEER